MAGEYSEAIFAPVLPKMRATELILAEIQTLSPNKADDISRKQVLEIELIIKQGDNFYRRRSYNNALDKFREARAKIYKILYPPFDIYKFIVSQDKMLPNTIALEKKITELSDRMANMVLPSQPLVTFTTGLAVDPQPDNIKDFMRSGLRENVDLSDELQYSAINGAAHMQNRNYKAAIEVMGPALQKAQQTPDADGNLKAALELNLAIANLQNDQLANAETLAKQAQASFITMKDEVGQSQAMHVQGIISQKKGDANSSKRFLSQASDMIKKAAGQALQPVVAGQPAVTGQPAISATLLPLRANISKAAIEFAKPVSSVNMGFAVNATTELDQLQDIQDMKTNVLSFRIPGRMYGWGTLPVENAAIKDQTGRSWMVGIGAGDKMIDFAVGSKTQAISAQIQANIYEVRKTALEFKAIRWVISDVLSTTFYLTQLYSYVLPVKIGDCFAELGSYAKAEEYYLQAAGYSYINKNVEGVQLWLKIAHNCLQWGNSLYKDEKLPEAKVQYNKLIGNGAAVPNSKLYTLPAFSVAAAQATNLIQKINQRPLPVINFEISMLVLIANNYLLQIEDNLDFYGLLLSPIHTFEYLQNVARAQAQQAIQAEREYVNFKNREEMEAATRRELETAAAMAKAEADARLEQWKSAQEDEQAATAALELSKQRRDNAEAQRDAYAASSWDQIWGQAASMALSGGEDAYWSEIKELVDKLDRGETISGPGPKLAAAQALRAGMKTREYELKKMQDTVDELTAAITVAQNQLDSAKRRTAAAEIAYQAALQRTQMAQEALNAFDDEFFTPDTWSKMANIMRDISRDFLYRAIRIAKLMERAYNFDNDTTLSVIKNEYGYAIMNTSDVNDAKLLGGDSLLNDIESFTYLAITTKVRKSSRIKDVISIASNFPAQFNAFRNTGLLSFETDLYEFDRLHPGFYEQRIEAIEVEIVGVIPDTGLNGTLKAGGVTRFRKKNNTAGKRVHQVDTMALSNFTIRNDVFLYSTESGVRGLFQGFGVGSTFQLHLPKRSNNFDFRRIFDINLVIYYTAKFDIHLKDTILALPVRPGEMEQRYDYGMRYDFPDAWYSFYSDGKLHFNMDRARLPFNQQNFKVKSVIFRVVTKQGVAANGIQVSVTGPDNVKANGTTGILGVLSSIAAPLNVLNGQNPIGNWSVEITGGASLKDGDVMKWDRVYNIQMGLEYSFEYVPEEI